MFDCNEQSFWTYHCEITYILISKYVSLNISDVQNKYYYYFAKLLHSKKSDYGFRNVADSSTPFLHKANFM